VHPLEHVEQRLRERRDDLAVVDGALEVVAERAYGGTAITVWRRG